MFKMKHKEGYHELTTYAGMTIEGAVAVLRYYHTHGCKACMEFNGTYLYSDAITVDSAYLAVTGKTKIEYDLHVKAEHDRYIREENEHKMKIPQLIVEWKREGRKILDKKYWPHWDEILPIRLGDLYKGAELPMCLDIVKLLNNGRSLEEARNVLNEQGHSGLSYCLVINMVNELCDRGSDFKNYVMSDI